MRAVGAPNVHPIRCGRSEAAFRNVVSEQRHRNPENRVAQRLESPHLEKIVLNGHFHRSQRDYGSRRRAASVAWMSKLSSTTRFRKRSAISQIRMSGFTFST